MDAIDELILGFQNLKGLENDVRKAANLITDSFKTSGKLLLCGNGGKLGQITDIAIKAPADDVARIQELHLPIYHAICFYFICKS